MAETQQAAEVQLEILNQAKDDVTKALEQEPLDVDLLQGVWNYYNTEYKTFLEVYNKRRNALAKEGKADEVKAAMQTITSARKNKSIFDVSVGKKLTPAPPPVNPGPADVGAPPPAPESTLKLMLPKRELPQFTGEIRDWLSFIASFQEIDTDKTLSDADKFHYLIQSTKEGSPARKLLQSYPFHPTNYQNAFDGLSQRYGRNNVLVKVYVRDLLQLVIEASTGKKQDFCELVTTISSQIQNLAVLGVTNDKCAQVLYPVVECCLPPDVLQTWQRHPNFSEDLSDLMEFLKEEVNRHTERSLAHFNFGTGRGNNNNSGDTKSSINKQQKRKGEVATTSCFYTTSDGERSNSDGGNRKSPTCGFCEKSHSTKDCPSTMPLSLQEKKELAKSRGICPTCFKKANHPPNKCFTNMSCSVCTKKHYLIMCPLVEAAKTNSSSSSSSITPKKSPAPQKKEETTTSTASSSNVVTEMTNEVQSPETPLQTLSVILHGPTGKLKRVRAVVDGGSQRTYILSSLADELELNLMGEESVYHQVFGARKTPLERHNIVKVLVAAINGQEPCRFSCSTKDEIAYNVLKLPPGPWMNEFSQKGVIFEDSNSTEPIGILIGNDIAARIYTGRIEHLPNGLSAMETKWGWVACGKIPRSRSPQTYSLMVTDLLQIEGRPLSALWDLETIGIKDPAEKEDKEELAKQTQDYFDKTVVQLADGRYQVSLPWLTGAKQKLPSNYYTAACRLRATTKDLQVKGYLEKYDELFKQWEQGGMIEEVPSDQLDNVNHYLPHRAVIKLSSATTPVRPVFDASSKAKGRLSLNDCLEKGPNLLELIPLILTRFRLYFYALLADIEKAFQQIGIDPDERDFLRFLWWKDLQHLREEKVYRHARVPFGATSSPYLLAATLRHHLKKATGEEAEIVKKLLSSLYVDNTVLSVPTEEQAKKFKSVATSLLLPAQFNLRDWVIGPGGDGGTISVLGLRWDTNADTLSLDVSKPAEKTALEPTLRHVLSLVHAIFDPLGFVSPFTIVGKILLRRCHEGKLGMDTPLPEPLRADILKWAAQIPLLSELRIPRHVRYGEDAVYSIHTMSDASGVSTAAAVFLRREDHSGEVRLFLLASKSRVAPKKATIPRLELVACVVAARLTHSVLEDMGNPPLPVFYWSDSSTALAWIHNPGPWGVFVTNCVTKITDITQRDAWRHIPGVHNAADLPSRGCSARKLLESKWWEGPEWLLRPPTEWPTIDAVPDSDIVDQERRKTVTTTVVTRADHPMEQFLRFSNYPRIIKAISTWLELKENLRRKTSQCHNNNSNQTSPQPPADISKAEYYLLLYVQLELQQKPERLTKLQPFLDEFGLLRTRTRLTLQDDAEFQCPILLPDENEFVFRLVRWEHETHCHVGISSLLGILRERFWVINGRRVVRKIVTSCWICRRFAARRATVPTGPLPSSRTGMGAPFAVTGVDAAGPLILRGGEKVWILLFTCATFRAVHLEVVNGLTADTFIRALRRFVSRRGRPNVIYSDNACGFVAAQKSLARLDWSKVKEFADVSRIQWRFNPPSSPWWGGFWERLIGMAKQLLRRILGRRVVQQWELETLICEVEDCLNNRPLTHSSEDPEDPQPLTPNHFVRHNSAVLLPEADLRDSTATRAAFKKLQHLREALRSRFRREYLGFLRSEQCSKSSTPLKVGDVVLVEWDHHKRIDWPLAVILEAIPGRDGVNRLFRLKTRSGEMLRPAQRLFPLEQELQT